MIFSLQYEQSVLFLKSYAPWASAAGAPLICRNMLRHAEPHTYRTHAYNFVWSSSSVVNSSRARTYAQRKRRTTWRPYWSTYALSYIPYIYAMHFMVNWQLSNYCIRWPVPHGYIAASGWKSPRSSVYFWSFIGSRAQVFSLIIRLSTETGASLLGLA